MVVASLVAEHGFWGSQASVVAMCGLSSGGSRAPGHNHSSCGTWAHLLLHMWDLPRPGIEPISLALAGRFFATEPPGKPCINLVRLPMPSLPVCLALHTMTAMKWQRHHVSLQTTEKPPWTPCQRLQRAPLLWKSSGEALTVDTHQSWFRKSWCSSSRLWFAPQVSSAGSLLTVAAKLLSPELCPFSFPTYRAPHSCMICF